MSYDRRGAIQLALAAVPALLSLRSESVHAAVAPAAAATVGGAERDFDYFLGSWMVHHRKLKKRLAGSNEWEEFDGTTTCLSLLGGIANMNDSTVNRRGRVIQGTGPACFRREDPDLG
jgi:hypothetical protein